MDRRRTGQGGLTLLEVAVAIFLLAGIFVSLAAGLLTLTRSTVANTDAQTVDAALVSYGEIVRTQVAYRPCAAGVAAAYQTAALAGLTTTGNPGATPSWRQPDGMTVAVTTVDSWDPTARSFATGCLSPDPGAQRIGVQVDYRGTTRTAQIVKRSKAPA